MGVSTSTAALPALPRKDFSARLDTACDAFGVPPLHRGRQSWVKNRLTERFSETVSSETVSKWFAGETKPNERRVRFLAQLLDVREAWLSLGDEPRSIEAHAEHPETAIEKSRGTLMLERLRRELGGSVTIAPGVDLTEPTGEIWDAER